MGCAIAHELREDRLIASIHCDERVSDMAGKKHAGNKGANSEALNRASAVRTARKSVLELLGMSIVPAVLSLLFDMTVVMGGASQGTLSVVATAVLLIATIAVIAFEVRAYRRIIAVEDSVEIVVQVNGKVKARFNAPVDCAKEELENLAFDLPEIKALTDGKTVVKKIAVPNKLVNIVVK